MTYFAYTCSCNDIIIIDNPDNPLERIPGNEIKSIGELFLKRHRTHEDFKSHLLQKTVYVGTLNGRKIAMVKGTSLKNPDDKVHIGLDLNRIVTSVRDITDIVNRAHELEILSEEDAQEIREQQLERALSVYDLRYVIEQKVA